VSQWCPSINVALLDPIYLPTDRIFGLIYKFSLYFMLISGSLIALEDFLLNNDQKSRFGELALCYCVSVSDFPGM
jgi:hypothetical protein